MKLIISTVAALFMFITMIMPASAMADSIVTLQAPPAYGQLFPTAYWGYHGACRDPHFRHHHHWLCW